MLFVQRRGNLTYGVTHTQLKLWGLLANDIATHCIKCITYPSYLCVVLGCLYIYKNV